MKLKSYKEILKMSKEKINAALAPIRTSKAKKQAELEIVKLEEKQCTQEANLQELCSNQELNFNSIITTLDEIALTTRRIRQLNTIIQELFPND